MVHLRRWAFQDILLVPAGGDTPAVRSPLQIYVSCVLGQLESVAGACRDLSRDSVTGPYDTGWRTRDIDVLTPERTQVLFTAARPFDPDNVEGQNLTSVGILGPDAAEEGAQ